MYCRLSVIVSCIFVRYIGLMESRRQLQTGELIKRHFSTVIREQGSYIYGSEVLVSVTRVIMSPDLGLAKIYVSCLLYTSPSPRDRQKSRMPSSA